MTTDVALAPTDDELVHRFAQGDDNAFVALYDRYVDRIYDFTARLLGDREAAADATQETFLKALTALRERPPQGGVRPWLFTIARNVAIDQLRRRRTTPLSALRTPEGDEWQPVQLSTGPDDDPEAAASQAELAALVWQAARGLNPADYALLDLSVRQGLSPEEIAQAMGASRGSIHTRLSRLRDALEESLTTLILAQRGRADCPELAALLAGRTLPADLTPELRRAVARHADQCETCQRNRRRYATAAEILPVLVPIVPSPSLRETLRERIQQAAQPSTAPGASSSPTAGAGHWLTTTAIGKGVVALMAVFVLAALGVGGARWGTVDVSLQTTHCPPLELRFGGVGDLVARATGLPPVLAPGQPAHWRLPIGTLRTTVTPAAADLAIDGLPVQIHLEVDLAQVLWDGQELLGQGPRHLSLARGSTHTLTLVCR
jgi:RNA polymerase sigma factor (sigma-70 family)